MTSKAVLFIQGGGPGAHAADGLLADSLKHALGAGYDVHFPRMPEEDEPDFARWLPQIDAALAHLKGDVTLVGHSLGGAALLRYLSQPPARPARVTGLVLLAAPAWDGQRWAFDDLLLPADLADRLAAIPRLAFYHCRDDEVVPFAHLALHGAKLPRAALCALEVGGHQFGNDLSRVAADIQAGEAV